MKLNLDKIKKVFFIIISFLTLTTFADQKECLNYYSNLLSSSKAIQSWHLHEPTAIGNFKEPRYTPTGKVFELKEAQVSNQCRTSECYLFAMINFVNVHNANQSNRGAEIVSSTYLVAHKFLQHISEGIWYGTDSDRVIHNLRGGFPYEALHLTREVGLVPESQWKPKVPFENWDMKTLYSVLEAKVPEWHKYLSSLASSKGNWDHPAVREAEVQGNRELSKYILDLTGDLPKQVEFNGQSYTPKDLEKIIGAPRQTRLYIDLKPGYSLPNGVNKVLDEAMVNHQGGWKYAEGNFETIMKNAINFIRAGQPVIMDFNWNEDGHSLLMVGYEVSPDGKVARIKAMNSWGTQFANEGYAWYTVEDVWNRVRRSYKFGKLE